MKLECKRGAKKVADDAAKNHSTPIAQAIRALAPSRTRQEIMALFENRVSWGAIRHWRAGRRRPSQWAVECLRQRVASVFEIEAAKDPTTRLPHQAKKEAGG
jgi:hypothetical protein